MSGNKKFSTPLLLAGLAAFAYYRYLKMSEEEKIALLDKLKDQGRKIFDHFIPDSLKNTFAEIQEAADNNGNLPADSSDFVKNIFIKSQN